MLILLQNSILDTFTEVKIAENNNLNMPTK